MSHPALHTRRGRAAAGLWVALLATATLAAGPSTRPAPPEFSIHLDPKVTKQPYTGRVYLVLTQQAQGEPVRRFHMFSQMPLFAVDVRNWRPGTTITLPTQRMLGHPYPPTELPAGTWRVQAAIDLNRWSQDVIAAPGNGLSRPVCFEHRADAPARVAITIDHTIERPKYEDSPQIRYVRLRSERLSRFWGRDVYLQAAVGLPDDYDEHPDRRYPAVYIIPGFGGSLRYAEPFLRFNPWADAGLDVVRVFLDPDCPTGHHVFADSDNNGPWSTALVRELIPHLEREFRIIAEPRARFVMGHSSGGWASLWLQIRWPEFFGGVWSLSPDPVDFTAFQLTDIYDPEDNMYYYPDGREKLVARARGGRRLTVRALAHVETVLGRGGQLQSFEAVFSPRGRDGRPVHLWDWQTGRINPKIAKAWQRYDIRRILEQNWSTLGPKLAGKLHIICGDADTFFLERAVLRLRDVLRRLGSDAKVTMIPGAPHSLPPKVFQQVAVEMKQAFEAAVPAPAGP